MTSSAGPIKLRRRLYYVPQSKQISYNLDVKIRGDFTNPPWEVELPCAVDETYGMYYHDLEMTDDKEIVFKFLSDNQHWCLSALYDVKQDENNCNFFNNHISGSSLISKEDKARDLSHSEKSQIIAHRIGKKNRAIEN